MKMQNTPLVQKLILVMLVLIFGCLVLMLVNGRKQIESLRSGPPVSAPVDSTSDDASIRQAYPSLRSSKHPPAHTVSAPEPAKPDPAPDVATKVEAPAVIAPQPEILPVAVAVEQPEASIAETGISGRVVLVGTPPPEIPIRFDATCGQLHPTDTTTRRFVVSPQGGLANALVYISKGLEGKKFSTPTNTVLIDQTNCTYQPYVVGTMINQPIQIRNSDPVLHNVHALPHNTADEFNFAQPQQGQLDQRAFNKPELFVKMRCDVHDWMLCYVSVFSHPFFAVTDANGNFELPSGLPPGRYEVTVAHLKAGMTSQKILLKKDATVHLEFRLPVSGKPWPKVP